LRQTLTALSLPERATASADGRAFAQMALEGFLSAYESWRIHSAAVAGAVTGRGGILDRIAAADSARMAAEARADAAEARAESLAQDIEKMRCSRSWRVTAPLRASMSLVTKLRGG